MNIFVILVLVILTMITMNMLGSLSCRNPAAPQLVPVCFWECQESILREVQKLARRLQNAGAYKAHQLTGAY